VQGKIWEWHRPFLPIGSYLTILIFLLITIWTIIVGDFTLTPEILLLSSVSMLAGLAFAIFLRVRLRDIWSSRWKILTVNPEDIVPLLEEALKAAGLEPVVRTGKRPRPIWKTIDLRGGLNISITEPGTMLSGVFFEIHVGPVSDATKQEVENIERIVDMALKQAGG